VFAESCGLRERNPDASGPDGILPPHGRQNLIRYSAWNNVMSLRARLASRLDLLLENIALHHQLMVLERSSRRSRARTFNGSDRWLWVLLSRLWACWREALTVIQPQTVVRWRRTPWWRHLLQR
jgi:hypothetical protein